MKKTAFRQSRTKQSVLLTFTFLPAITAAVQYALRASCVYIDNALFKGFSAVLLALSVLTALGLLVLTVLSLHNIQINGKRIADTRAFSNCATLFEIVAVVFFVYATVNLLSTGTEFMPMILNVFGQSLPLFIGLGTVTFLLCIYPVLKNGVLKKCIAAVLALGVLMSALWTLLPYCNYKITSAPMVIDSGENYAVVFATNDTGTGFLEYSYHGEAYTLYDESAGRLKGDSKIHTVKVPKAHLEGNTYRVGSTRILEERSYGGRSGKTVYSAEYTFTVPMGDTQTYLSVSDWHTRLQKAYDAISYAGDFDGVILLGDAVPGLMFEDDIVENIVEFGGTVSGGTKPVIYVRGNHETRGGYASKLADYLGLDGFYYETAYGDYNFLVLDSGEDKPDNHPEYGGMVNYGAYRAAMVDWLCTLPKSENKTLTLVHDSDIAIEEELRTRAQTELLRLGATQILSGHYHICDYKEENGLRVYVDGGHNDGTFIASKLTLAADGYRLEAWNNSGEQVFSKDLDW